LTFGNRSRSFYSHGHESADVVTSYSLVAANISPITVSGHSIPAPYEDYQGNLPKSVFPSRLGLETMLRRLVFGDGRYPNIEQLVGTVTGVQPALDDPTRLEKVTIRTKEGEMTLPAALVVGQFISEILTAPPVVSRIPFHRLHRYGTGWSEMASSCRICG
jgi:hypothetical protein